MLGTAARAAQLQQDIHERLGGADVVLAVGIA
jgi:hypothetical protein